MKVMVAAFSSIALAFCCGIVAQAQLAHLKPVREQSEHEQQFKHEILTCNHGEQCPIYTVKCRKIENEPNTFHCFEQEEPTKGFCDASGKCKMLGELCAYYDNENQEKTGTVQQNPNTGVLYCSDQVAIKPDDHLRRKN